MLNRAEGPAVVLAMVHFTKGTRGWRHALERIRASLGSVSQVACERAEERREAMSRSAYLVAHAPTDIQVLLAEIDHLNARLAATPPRTPTLDEIVEAIRSYGAQSEAPATDEGAS